MSRLINDFFPSDISTSILSLKPKMRLLVATLLSAALVSCLKFDLDEYQYNLNQNATATNPLDYWGEWEGHQYTPSPQNWRFPFYTLFLDRFVNGDPSNDDINGTFFEHDVLGTQMRHGGDLVGLTDTLDYIQGMGIKVRVSASCISDVRIDNLFREYISLARLSSISHGSRTSIR